MEYKRVLVICIDRDADVTTKIGEEGPIYGKESVLSVATRLGLADPIETDTNALFEAIRIYDKYKNKSRCLRCGSNSNIHTIELSYAFKLLLDELKSLMVTPHIKLKGKF